MKHAKYILAAAIVLFAACDKIASDEYTMYAGIGASWSDGAGVANPVQRAYVEKYTGPKCINCPNADVTIDDVHHTLGDRLVAISINHYEGQGEPFPGEPDMRTAAGTVWDKYFGINALPAAYVNRNTSKQYSGAMNDIVAALQSAADGTPVVALELTADSNDSRELHVSVEMEMVSAYSRPMSLTLALIEDSLRYKQLTPNDGVVDDYAHNHMLRDVLTDTWGVEVDATGAAGEKRKATFSVYKVKDASVVLDNCHVVAILTDRASRQVLNAAQCTIE